MRASSTPPRQFLPKISAPGAACSDPTTLSPYRHPVDRRLHTANRSSPARPAALTRDLALFGPSVPGNALVARTIEASRHVPSIDDLTRDLRRLRSPSRQGSDVVGDDGLALQRETAAEQNRRVVEKQARTIRAAFTECVLNTFPHLHGVVNPLCEAYERLLLDALRGSASAVVSGNVATTAPMPETTKAASLALTPAERAQLLSAAGSPPALAASTVGRSVPSSSTFAADASAFARSLRQALSSGRADAHDEHHRSSRRKSSVVHPSTVGINEGEDAPPDTSRELRVRVRNAERLLRESEAQRIALREEVEVYKHRLHAAQDAVHASRYLEGLSLEDVASLSASLAEEGGRAPAASEDASENFVVDGLPLRVLVGAFQRREAMLLSQVDKLQEALSLQLLIPGQGAATQTGAP